MGIINHLAYMHTGQPATVQLHVAASLGAEICLACI